MTDFEDMLLKMLLKIRRQAPCVWKADDSVDGLFYRVTKSMMKDALVEADVTSWQITVSGLTPEGKASLADLQRRFLSTRLGHKAPRPVPAE